MKEWPSFFDSSELQPEVKKGFTMKGWHIGIIVAVLIGYFVGVMFPSVGNTVKAKLGV